MIWLSHFAIPSRFSNRRKTRQSEERRALLTIFEGVVSFLEDILSRLDVIGVVEIVLRLLLGRGAQLALLRFPKRKYEYDKK